MANTTPNTSGDATSTTAAVAAEEIIPAAAQEAPPAEVVAPVTTTEVAKPEEKSEHEKLLDGVTSVLTKPAEDGVKPDTTKPAEASPVVATDAVAKPAETPVAAATQIAQTDDELPFKEHPRFVEMKTQLAQLPTLQEHSQRLATLQQFVHGNGISEAEFQEGLAIMAALKNNPLHAAKLLAPHIKNLGAFTGDGDLPADLAQRVTDGEISDTAARELVRSRTEAAVERQRVASMERERTAAVTQQSVQATQTAVMAWEQRIAASDPDYQLKQELVIGLIRAEAAKLQASALTANEAVAIAQRCYEQANKIIKPLSAKALVATKPTPSSAASLPTRAAVVAKPKSLEEGVDAALARVKR